jgi:hypothetical protein
MRMVVIKKYLIVAAIVLPVSIMVIVKTFVPGRFRYDADRWAQASYDQTNLITFTEMESMAGHKLVINLGDGNKELNGVPAEMINITPDSILQRKYSAILRDHDGPVILMSPDTGLSARIWMVLSQTGMKNLYILIPDNTTELFKYEFRPLPGGAPEF